MRGEISVENETLYRTEKRFSDAIAEAGSLSDAPEGYLAPDVLHQLPKNTPLLLGFSGGTDSSVLLFLAYAYAKRNGAPLRIVHVHHGIRGDEADRDATFAEQIAKAYELPISVVYKDVPRIAAECGESIEAAARRVRYEAFRDVMREYGIPVLLTAHNADDNLETVLFHLLRGSGLSGLTGIPPRRRTEGGTVIRPLLECTRADLELFRERYAIPAIFDSTNDDVSYTRNRLRKEIVPGLREISPAPERAVSRMTAALRRDAELLDRLAEDARRRAESPEGLDRSMLADEPDAVVLRVLLRYWKDAVPTLDSYESVHLDALLRLLRDGRDRTHLSLPHSTAELRNGRLSIGARSDLPPPPPFTVPLSEGENPIDALDVSLFLGEAHGDPVPLPANRKNIYNSATQIYIPFDTIRSVYGKEGLTARGRLPGDRILVGGMHRSLRTLLNRAAFTKEEREHLLVVTDGQELLWVPGLAVSDLVSTERKDARDLPLTISRLPF